MSKDLSILFMGSRGGGSLFFLQVTHLLQKRGLLSLVVISDKNDEKGNLPPNLGVVQIKIPNKKFVLFRPLYKRVTVKRIIGLFIKSEIKTVIIPMLHPWDRYLMRRLQEENIKCIVFIHDYPPHPMSLFPTKRFTERVVRKAWQVVVLSNYVMTNLSSLRKDLSLKPFPDYSSVAILKKDNFSFARQNAILFIGRNDRYKNIKVGIKAVEFSDFNGKVIVAGSIGKSIGHRHDFELINRWLSRSELEYLISTCSLLVLPYSSATQSGLIAIARYYEIPVVVTPVGGLVEQVSDYPLGYVSGGIDSQSIGEAIQKALNDREQQVPIVTKVSCQDSWVDSFEK